MAYAINMVQRVSDGAIYTGGGFIEVNNPANYKFAAFFGGDPDSVPQLVSGLAAGEYRIIPYWMPGTADSNLPAYGGNIFSNFTAGMAANTVDIRGFRGSGEITGDMGNLFSEWQANGYPQLFFFFTEEQNVSYFDGRLEFWDGSLGLSEFIGLFGIEGSLFNTESGTLYIEAPGDWGPDTIQWAFLMKG